MKVTATLKGELDSLGRKTVYIRIADGAKRKFFATPIRLEPKYWKKKVIGHSNAKALNEQIKSLIMAYEVKREPDRVLTFYQFAQKCLRSWEHTKKASTLYQIQSKVKKFKDYKDCKLSEVNYETLSGYVQYCYGLGNSGNTVWVSIKVIRTIIAQAKREGLITYDPFLTFKMPKYKDPQKQFLTIEQVNKIEDFARSNTGSLSTVAAWFVISCYTGLRYSDQTKFSKDRIKSGRIIIYTTKTGQVVSMPLNDKLKSLFELVKFKPNPHTNEHCNRALKAIGALCEIEEPLSMHVSRHTFGTLCASAGISQEVTGKLMGHNTLRTTAVYYQLTSERIDKEFNKIFKT